MKILVSGGSGFIGSAVIRQLIKQGVDEVVNLDLLTYAAYPGSLDEVEDSSRYSFEQADICDIAKVRDIFLRHQPDVIMHLAAESHVDRSIDHPAKFIETNIVGTQRMLDVALEYYELLPDNRKEVFRFHHVSTDEVYGSLGKTGLFSEETPYAPRSPYSASKAASDFLVSAWHHTYELPIIISNCSNNYGPYQFPEKLIPLVIINGLKGRPLPVYGQGENIRDWLFVDDHATALLMVLRSGKTGESYLIGGQSERRNIDVVREICAILDNMAPDSSHRPHSDLIKFVEDRPGHDLRYAIDFSKTQRKLGWMPSMNFSEGLRRTVGWYLEHQSWWEPMLDKRYDGERLGLGKRAGE